MAEAEDPQTELKALVEAVAATIAVIDADFMAGRLAGPDILKAIALLATFQNDLRPLREEVATFVADRAATLQLTLEVAAGVPLSASSVAVMATVKAAIKRLGIKTQPDAAPSLSKAPPAPTTAPASNAEGTGSAARELTEQLDASTPLPEPTPAAPGPEPGDVTCEYCGGDHPVNECEDHEPESDSQEPTFQDLVYERLSTLGVAPYSLEETEALRQMPEFNLIWPTTEQSAGSAEAEKQLLASEKPSTPKYFGFTKRPMREVAGGAPVSFVGVKPSEPPAKPPVEHRRLSRLANQQYVQDLIPAMQRIFYDFAARLGHPETTWLATDSNLSQVGVTFHFRDADTHELIERKIVFGLWAHAHDAMEAVRRWGKDDDASVIRAFQRQMVETIIHELAHHLPEAGLDGGKNHGQAFKAAIRLVVERVGPESIREALRAVDGILKTPGHLDAYLDDVHGLLGKSAVTGAAGLYEKLSAIERQWKGGE